MHGSRWRRPGVALCVAVAAAGGVAGCGATRAAAPVPTVTTTTRSTTTTTVVHGHRTVAAGVTVTVADSSQGLRLAITAARPTLSHERLSPSYGLPPRNGRYLTVGLHLVNAGSVPAEVTRLDFVLVSPGLGRLTTNDGNAPYSGSSRQLDTTVVGPHQQLSNALTFDVRSPGGTLLFAPGGHIEAAWRLPS